MNAEYNQNFPTGRTEVLRVQAMATDALQEAAEAYLHEFFKGMQAKLRGETPVRGVMGIVTGDVRDSMLRM